MICTLCSWIFYTISIFIFFKVIDFIVRYPQLGRRLEKHVFITGCDSGFGREAAKRLDMFGINVIAGCLTDLGETVLKKQASYRLKTVHIDVSKPDSVQKALNFVTETLPEGKGLWGLVNNAGIGGSYIGPPEWLTLDDYKEVMEVNFHGLVSVTQTFLPLVKKEKGRVVNTASLLGRFTFEQCAPYCVSKHGVEAFSDILRREMRPFGVSVHIIEPTFFLTGINTRQGLQATYQKAWDRLPQHQKDQYGQQYIQDCLEKEIANYIRMGDDNLDPVVLAYEHALLSRLPKMRYLVGPYKYAFWVLMFLPEWIADKLLLLCNPGKPLPACIKS